jgi:hypothetical protein
LRERIDTATARLEDNAKRMGTKKER